MKKLMLVSAVVAAGVLSIGVAPAAAGTDGRVTVCHVPPGNPDNAHNITISVKALPAHLAHGDTVGPCTYPPRNQALIAPGTVGPGASFQATLLGCSLGEAVNFGFNGATTSVACNGPAGQSFAGIPSATQSFVAPTTPGTYTMVATGATSGTSASATITVVGANTPSGGLPTTGSDSGQTLRIGAGLVAVGAGLTVVAVRRRKAAHA
jgi:LPXTG-motif cell wall-anchored protein